MKVFVATVILVTLCYIGGVYSEEKHEAVKEWQGGDEKLQQLVRVERANLKAADGTKPAKNKKPKGDACKYVKGTWSDCDPKTNMRTRTLTLKKGDQTSCEATKTIQKKCKKGKQSCQYDKGAWSACSTPQNQMTRTDRLKAGSDASCEPTRQVTRPCKNKQSSGTKKQMKGQNGSGRRNRQ